MMLQVMAMPLLLASSLLAMTKRYNIFASIALDNVRKKVKVKVKVKVPIQRFHDSTV